MGLRLRDLVRQGNLQELQRIAEEHEDLCDVNFQDKHGWTILHYAARNGQLQVSSLSPA